jgi:hypothetical protein
MPYKVSVANATQPVDQDTTTYFLVVKALLETTNVPLEELEKVCELFRLDEKDVENPPDLTITDLEQLIKNRQGVLSTRTEPDRYSPKNGVIRRGHRRYLLCLYRHYLVVFHWMG